MSETIFALSTGAGPSAVAVIRISGKAAGVAIERFCSRSVAPRKAALCSFRHPETRALIDRGLVLWFPAPLSATGEDCAEFHIHGGRSVIQITLRALADLPGFRPAQPGEFIRRAYLNGKVDLTEVEGIGDLIAAETIAQHRQAVAISAGALFNRVEEWRRRLTDLAAELLAIIDFVDEDDTPAQVSSRFWLELDKLLFDLRSVLAEARRGEIVREGFSVVISGPPNAGKSSLMNALARRDVAIVSSHAGTTRDLLEIRLDLDGFPVILVDTAGLRTYSDDVEAEGMRRAIARAAAADLVIWMTESAAPEAILPALQDAARVLKVGSKVDLARGPDGYDLQISVKTGEGIDELLNELSLAVSSAAGGGEPALISRERQRAELVLAVDALSAARGHSAALELLAEDIRAASVRLSGIVGAIHIEDVLEQVFSRFCIGK